MRGEIARRLARWRSTTGSGNESAVGIDHRAIDAAVQADTTGWIALLDDGRLVASVADGDRRADPGEAPDMIVRALELLDGAACHSDVAERDRAHQELDEWITRDWTRCSSGLVVAESPMRRRMRRVLDDALHTASRHQRATIFDRAARVRDALARPLPLGMERALDALADARSTHADWLDEAADLVGRAPGRARAPNSGAPRCRVLIVCCFVDPEVR
jgi:hypothetical protein